jgi:hypothetical protein
MASHVGVIHDPCFAFHGNLIEFWVLNPQAHCTIVPLYHCPLHATCKSSVCMHYTSLTLSSSSLSPSDPSHLRGVPVVTPPTPAILPFDWLPFRYLQEILFSPTNHVHSYLTLVQLQYCLQWLCKNIARSLPYIFQVNSFQVVCQASHHNLSFYVIRSFSSHSPFADSFISSIVPTIVCVSVLLLRPTDQRTIHTPCTFSNQDSM